MFWLSVFTVTCEVFFLFVCFFCSSPKKRKQKDNNNSKPEWTILCVFLNNSFACLLLQEVCNYFRQNSFYCIKILDPLGKHLAESDQWITEFVTILTNYILITDSKTSLPVQVINHIRRCSVVSQLSIT